MRPLASVCVWTVKREASVESVCVFLVPSLSNSSFGSVQRAQERKTRGGGRERESLREILRERGRAERASVLTRAILSQREGEMWKKEN